MCSSDLEMKGIVSDFLAPYRGSMQIEWAEPELVEAATVLAGVTRIEAENSIATLLAKGAILKTDLAELSKVKDRIFSDISGLERVKLSAKIYGNVSELWQVIAFRVADIRHADTLYKLRAEYRSYRLRNRTFAGSSCTITDKRGLIFA